MNSEHMQRFLSKKMTRREFLAYIGVLVFAISGISGLFERIHQTQKIAKPRQPKTGFGSGAYGV